MSRLLIPALCVALLALGASMAGAATTATITINATGLSPGQGQVLEVAHVFPTAAATTVDLTHGTTYTLAASGSVQFQVTAAGLIDYDAALDSILSGRGTSTLIVQGLDFVVDASATDYEVITHLIFGSAPDAGPVTWTVLPGTQRITWAGGFMDVVLDVDGTIDFDTDHDAYASGRGTDTLVLVGFSVSFDARALSASVIQIIGLAGHVFPADTVTTLRFLPGETFRLLTTSPYETFGISPDGTFDYDTSFETFLSGRGTSTLTITGFDITFDARGLAPSLAQLINYSGGALPSDATVTLTLPPGGYFQLLGAGGPLNDNQLFGVDLDGLLVDLPATYAGHAVTGEGTRTLTIGTFDDEAPEVTASVEPEMLWPPNHKLVEVDLYVVAHDAIDASPTVTVSVTSSDPDDARRRGDGRTTGDVRVTLTDGTVLASSNDDPVVSFDFAELAKLELRAERGGRGNSGRTYTISVVATDHEGNTGEASDVAVVVPKRRGKDWHWHCREDDDED